MQQSYSYSQISQDIFVLNFFEKKAGYFLDLGCGNGFNHPCGNNTLLLEQNGWDGISIDIDQVAINHFNKNRKTKAICKDLTKENLADILRENNAPKVIDYMSFDVDQASEHVLASLPLDEYVFRFVTFEHNAYLPNEYYKNLKQNALNKFFGMGYGLLINNVILENHGAVEDWYVHSFSTLNLSKKPLKSLDSINHKNILTEYGFQ
jgi:SAM-dependent methyltransferase